MPGLSGPPPKPAGQRVRRNRDALSPVTVLPLVKGKQPDLPTGFNWHPMTLDWWHVWGASPLADLITDVDWNVLKRKAIFVDKVWRTGSTEAEKEVRQAETEFGAGIMSRLRLRIQLAEADQSGAPEVAAESAQMRFAGLMAVPTAVGE